MAPKARVSKSKKMYKSKGRKGRRGNVKDFASMSCSNGVPGGLTSNAPYVLDDIKLADFSRASAVAQGYQRFRIKSVKVTIKPNLDTFVSTGAGVAQKPYLYYMIDKIGAIPNIYNQETLREAGAKPIAIDEKPVIMYFKPTVYVSANDLNTGPAWQTYRTSPWLSTNANNLTTTAFAPSLVSHGGLKMYIEQVGAVTTFNVDVEVQL